MSTASSIFLRVRIRKNNTKKKKKSLNFGMKWPDKCREFGTSF